MSSEEKKERPVSMICEATNYNLASDYAAHPMSPVGRTSRSSKKVHNFGKRSNSIKRNPNAPVVRRGWLYKQDSTGMKLWKKRWFVLSDLCLFYYRDEKEEGILGSILLPSFHISVLCADDHINRKFAFKAAHPNMRTYYFCTDTGKEMELWMKAMIDAALVQTEPVKRIEKFPVENTSPREANNISNHRVLIKPEAQNNQKNKEVNKNEEKKALEAEKYGFQKVGQDRPLTKINSVKLQPLGSEYRTLPISTIPAGAPRAAPGNGAERRALDAGDGAVPQGMDRVVQRTSSMLQLEQWIRTQRGKGQDEENRGVVSYQTLPRNMPSHRAQVLPRYPEGYRTLPRNSKARPDSLCSVAPCYEDKRRSMRDDTMWQLYEWQQRQFYSKQGTLGRQGTLSSPKTVGNVCEQPLGSIPTSPSHAAMAFSPQRAFRSELSSPVQRADVTLERRHRTAHGKHVFVPDRRSMPAALTLQPVTPQSLQGKTAKLSRLCEQDKVVQALEEKLHQLHKEKYTLEQALLSASQEIEMNADNPAAIQPVVLQRDDLQNGLLSTCREVSRATAELERAWREYDKLEYDVTVTRNHMQEQLDRLGEIQTESAGIQRAQLQKELWRIQDVMEGLLKHKQQRSSSEAGIMVSRTFSSIKYKNEGPDYRLYKSEPELTTVAEVDESNGEEKTEPVSESESSGKGSHFPVGVVPPRTKSPTPESSTIASYVTLRKNKKIDLRTERPRSAVEQLCLAEGPRPRMPLQEQMERIKRHQQACLRDRRRGLSILGAPEQPPAPGSSSARDNPLRLAQNRRKEDAGSANGKEAESTSREKNLKQNHGSPGEETEQLKNDGDEEHNSSFTKELSKTDDPLSDAHVVSDSKEGSNEEKAEKKNKLEEAHDGDISLQSVTTVANHKPKTSSEESEILSVQEQEGIVSSFEFAAQSSKGNQAAAVKSLPSSPESSLSPAPCPQTQLTEGSHFMCV
ncbi:pleckstrin homology domain-containing family A member 5-like isoform 6-T7 [Acridotheres tristis]